MKIKTFFLIVVISSLMSACNSVEDNLGSSGIKKIEFEDGLVVTLESELGGFSSYSVPQEWNEKTHEEVIGTLVDHLKTILGEDSDRFQELKVALEANVEYYKERNLHNIPIKEFYEPDNEYLKLFN